MIHPLSRLTPKHLAPSLIALLLGCPALAMPAHAGWLFGGGDDAPKHSSTADNAKDTPKMAPATDIEGNVRQARMLRQAGNYQEAIHHLSQLMLVASDNGQVVGVVSERDYARKMILQGRSSVGTPVSAIMSSPVVTVDSQQNIDTCMSIMTERHLRHLPVVENGQLVGLLSIGDLVKEAIAEQAQLIQQLEQYIRGEQ